MRLIDADKLMEDMQKTITEQSGTIDWLNLIHRQPTAYDMENVVEQLEGKVKELENISSNMVLNKYQKRQNYGYCAWIEHAIEIVKGGGVDEENI